MRESSTPSSLIALAGMKSKWQRARPRCLEVDLEGTKHMLAICACAQESQEGWMFLLQDLRTRGITQVDLIVTDGDAGLLAAVSVLFPATPRQRWKVA